MPFDRAAADAEQVPGAEWAPQAGVGGQEWVLLGSLVLRQRKADQHLSECGFCHVVWNRDISASYNMGYLWIFSCLTGGRRPPGFFVSTDEVV